MRIATELAPPPANVDAGRAQEAEHEIDVRRDEDKTVDDLVTGRFGRKP